MGWEKSHNEPLRLAVSYGRESNPEYSEYGGVPITTTTFSCFTLKEERNWKM
jgi:hypothetical protein